MALTPAQLTILKTSIQADGTFGPIFNSASFNSDQAVDIANAYNLNASPAFTVWRTAVTIEATGQAFNGAELAGMTTGNQTRLQTIAQYLANGYNAGLADVRQMFNDIWSGAGGTNTRANLLLLWKRLATRAEKLYAVGTGSDASPAVLGFEGAISYQDVINAKGA